MKKIFLSFITIIIITTSVFSQQQPDPNDIGNSPVWDMIRNPLDRVPKQAHEMTTAVIPFKPVYSKDQYGNDVVNPSSVFMLVKYKDGGYAKIPLHRFELGQSGNPIIDWHAIFDQPVKVNPDGTPSRSYIFPVTLDLNLLHEKRYNDNWQHTNYIILN